MANFKLFAMAIAVLTASGGTSSDNPNCQRNISKVLTAADNSTNANATTLMENSPANDLVWLEQLDFAIMTIYLPIVQASGLFGNGLAMYVLAKGVLTTSSRVYLTVLASNDFVYLALSIPWTLASHPEITASRTWKAFYSHYASYLFPCITICFTISVWTMLAFTIERFIIVVFPLKKQLLSTKHSQRVVVALFICGILLNVSRFFERVPYLKFDSETNQTYYSSRLTELRQNPSYTAIVFWVSFALSVVCPFLALTILNSVIVVNIRLASRKALQMTSISVGQSHTHRESRDAHITRLLFGMVIAFFLCNGCGAVLNALVGIYGVQILVQSWYRPTILVTNALILTNPTVNFVLYTVCSPALRKAIHRVLGCTFSSSEKQHTRNTKDNTGTTGVSNRY